MTFFVHIDFREGGVFCNNLVNAKIPIQFSAEIFQVEIGLDVFFICIIVSLNLGKQLPEYAVICIFTKLSMYS